MATEPFNCRIFGHFREGIASWRSLLQGGYLKQKIEIIGELNVSGNGNQQSVVSKTDRDCSWDGNWKGDRCGWKPHLPLFLKRNMKHSALLVGYVKSGIANHKGANVIWNIWGNLMPSSMVI